MRVLRLASAVALFAVTFSAVACADPIVRLPDATSWQTAISDGRVTGLNLNPSDPRFTSNTAALEKIYPGQATGYRDTSVSTDVSQVDGLVSSFGTTADTGTPTIGAWCYIGPDPDYTNFVFTMSAFLTQVGPAAGFDMVAFAMTDDLNRVKAWGWDSSVLHTGHNIFNFALKLDAGAGGSTFFFEDPLFDITKVTTLQGSFRGTLTPSFPGITGGGASLEAGTSKLAVAPEGDSLLLFGAGMVALVLLGRRRVAVRRSV